MNTPVSKGEVSVGRSILPVVLSVGLLIASQVLIFSPGTDVSPYAFTLKPPTPNTFGGLTVQVWAILLLLAICGYRLFFTANRTPSFAYVSTVAAVVVVTFEGLLTSPTPAVFAEGVGKLVLPLLLFVYFRGSSKVGLDRALTRLVIVVNVFTIGQAVVSRIVTGEFAANRYYLDLPREYFGYFYHPFAFAGILGACSIVAINEIRHGRHRFLMLGLLSVNIFFIYQTQVRTYILATAVAFIISLIGLTVGRRSAISTFAIAGALSFLAIAIGNGLVAGSRRTADASSGRLDRWGLDVQYVWDTATSAQLLFGGGPGYISEVNERLFGVQINSLNAVIDTFVDFGLIGLVLVVASWIALLREHYLQASNPLVLAVVALFGISALVTSPIEFPAVAVMLVVSTWALTPATPAVRLESEGEPVLSPATATGGSGRFLQSPAPRTRR